MSYFAATRVEAFTAVDHLLNIRPLPNQSLILYVCVLNFVSDGSARVLSGLVM